MSRAVRRQQAAAPKEGAKQRGSLGMRQPKPPARGSGTAPKQRRRLIPSWFEEIISELKKVTWPTREETIYLTTVVIIVAVVVGAALGVIDIFFNWLIDRLLLE